MAIIPDQKYALKGSQIEDLASRIGNNTGDIETLEAQIQALATDFSYKGSVADYAHLPADAATGDVYTTTDTGIIYVWDGNAWVALNEYPSVFVGTDGTNAGEEGLVPAPAADDAGKVLSADGGWVDNDNFYDVKVSTRTDKTYRELKTAWEAGKTLRFGSHQGVFWFWQKGFGSTNTFPITFASKRHDLYTLQGEVTYNGTGVPTVIKLELYMGATGSDWEDKTLSVTITPIANLNPAGLDATTPDYKIPSITVLKNALADREPVTIVNAGAPTTSTAAVSVGQQYYDSTNNKLYYCSAITAQGTDPETYTYTWSSFGPSVVQTTGTSTTDIMSQNAVTSMVFNDPATRDTVKIIGASNTNQQWAGSVIIGGGSNTKSRGNYGVSLGYDAIVNERDGICIGEGTQTIGGTTNAAGNVAVGARSFVIGSGSVALGYGAEAPYPSVGVLSLKKKSGYTTQGYNSSEYMLITGVYDPQNAHDAATKGYVDTAVAGAGSATINSTDWSALWQ